MGLKIPSLTVPGTFWTLRHRLDMFHKILEIATYDRTAYTVLRRTTTFRSMTDRIYDGGPIIL